MKAVILAAGKGTRMFPFTETIHKSMIPIANRPLFDHIIQNIIEVGITEFIFVVGHKKETIMDYFGDGKARGINIKYREQAKLNGTAMAVLQVSDLIAADERFMVLNGDGIIDSSDLKKLMNTKGDAVLSAKTVTNPQEYGILNTVWNRVDSIIEKPQNPTSALANVGAYIFTPPIFSAISSIKQSVNGEYGIPSSIQNLIDTGFDVRYVPTESFIDVGYPWQLLDANEIILERNRSWKIEGIVESFATVKGNVSVGKGTNIRNGAYIMGNVVIGKNCEISPNSYIRPYTSIGNNVKIGSGVEIKNSIIMDNTHIGHLNYIGDSIIGRNCNFGAGTQVANLRHDGKTIRVNIGNTKKDSGRRKLGVMMGDNVHTGINSTFNIGTVVKSGTNTRPGQNI